MAESVQLKPSMHTTYHRFGDFGDFFESVPPADLYLLRFILYDWDDQGSIKILQQCRGAMTTGARAPIVEVVQGRPTDPGWGALISGACG
jgi:hypothetical protein